MMKFDRIKEHDHFASICLALEAHASGCVLWSENPTRPAVQIDQGKFIDLLPLYLEMTRTVPENHYWISLPDDTVFPSAYGVRPEWYSFYQAVRDGNASVIDVDDWVDYWHNTAWIKEPKPSLRQFLGFSRELYAAYLKTNDAIMGLNTHGK